MTPRRGLAVRAILRDPTFRRLWVSGLCVNVARGMDMLALAWLALELTGSPFMVGLAAFIRSAPLIVIGPLAGIIADRVSRGRVLIAAQAAGAIVALGLCALFATGRGGYWPLVALEGLFGALWAIDFPARRAALYTLMGPGRVARAVSLETVSMQIAKMTGPLAAGLCLARFGPAVCFAIIAAVYAAGLAVSVGLGAHLAAPAPARARGSLAASLGAGARAAWAIPTVRAVLLATVAMNVLFFPFQHMLAVFVRDVLAAGPAWLGIMLAAEGLGSLVTALALASHGGVLHHRRLFAGSIVVLPLLLLALAGAHWKAVCLVVLVAIGVAESCYAAMQSTLVLLAAPEDARGGMMGILSACIGTQPLGSLWIGLVATGFGAPAAMALNGAVALVAVAPVAWPLARGPDAPVARVT